MDDTAMLKEAAESIAVFEKKTDELTRSLAMSEKKATAHILQLAKLAAVVADEIKEAGFSVPDRDALIERLTECPDDAHTILKEAFSSLMEAPSSGRGVTAEDNTGTHFKRRYTGL